MFASSVSHLGRPIRPGELQPGHQTSAIFFVNAEMLKMPPQKKIQYFPPSPKNTSAVVVHRHLSKLRCAGVGRLRAAMG